MPWRRLVEWQQRVSTFLRTEQQKPNRLSSRRPRCLRRVLSPSLTPPPPLSPAGAPSLAASLQSIPFRPALPSLSSSFLVVAACRFSRSDPCHLRCFGLVSELHNHPLAALDARNLPLPGSYSTLSIAYRGRVWCSPHPAGPRIGLLHRPGGSERL